MSEPVPHPPEQDIRRLSGNWLRMLVLAAGIVLLAIRRPDQPQLITALLVYLGLVLLALAWPKERRPWRFDMLYPLLVCDIAAITLVAYCFGSQTYPITALYVPLVIGYALQTNRRAGVVAFLLANLGFGGILLLEEMAILTRAPLVRGHLPPHTVTGGALAAYLAFLISLAAGYIFVIYVLRNVERQHQREKTLMASEQKARQRTKSLELELEDARHLESLARLAGGVAHDFNNLLTSIYGYTQMASDALGPDHRCRTDLDQVRLAAKRAAELTDQLLAFSRQQIRYVRTLDLSEHIAGMKSVLEEAAGERCEVVIEPAREPCTVEADPGQIERMLTSLASNASEAMPGGGTLTISVDRVTIEQGARRFGVNVPTGEFVRVQVSDDGPGMDAATLSRVFEPFFTTKGIGEGPGLGLSTVYGIVRQNHGFIEVSSEPSSGTRFDIIFPRGGIR